MSVRKLTLVALGALLTLGLSACGGDDGDGGNGSAGGEGTSASAYAAEVCGAMKDWVSTVQEKSSALGESAAAGDAEEGKELLVTLLGDISDATGDLVGAVEDAGVPDVDNGEEISANLADAFRQAQQILDDAQEDVEALPSDPAAFQQGAAEIGPTLQEAISSITASLEGSQSDELDQAFEEEEACQTVAS
jgi:hypothetical protein